MWLPSTGGPDASSRDLRRGRAPRTLGCGSWSRVGSGRTSRRASESLTRVLNSTQFYQRLGRLAAADPLPFVGTVAFAAGPADSVIGVLGLSLENRALAFQREGNVFVARYRVSLSFKREGAPSVDVAREEIVRVPTFQETLRSDESILFQQVLRLVPGKYVVERDRARRGLDLREPRPGRLHGAELRGGQT